VFTLSGELVNALRRRARSLLKHAYIYLNDGDFDLACYNCQQALELYLKSLIYELFGEEVKICSLRELLGILHKRLRDAGRSRDAELIETIIENYRGVILGLEDANVDARYGTKPYDRKDAMDSIEAVEQIIEKLEKVRKRVVA